MAKLSKKIQMIQDGVLERFNAEYPNLDIESMKTYKESKGQYITEVVIAQQSKFYGDFFS